MVILFFRGCFLFVGVFYFIFGLFFFLILYCWVPKGNRIFIQDTWEQATTSVIYLIRVGEKGHNYRRVKCPLASSTHRWTRKEADNGIVRAQGPRYPNKALGLQGQGRNHAETTDNCIDMVNTLFLDESLRSSSPGVIALDIGRGTANKSCLVSPHAILGWFP